MSAYFVTAIGTDVGKTFAACALLHGARQAGRPTHALKPVACGIDHAMGGDVAELNAASGHVDVEQSPWWFNAPLSPNMAATVEGKIIDIHELTQWTRARIPSDGLTLIEGVGGLMVPLNDTQTVRDWVAALDLPIILVAGTYLGALNHTLLTLEALRVAKLKVAALIISESTQGVSLGETEKTVRRFAQDIPLIIAQPCVNSWRQATNIHALARSGSL
jgi:dethiobiotin synthetase